MNSDNQLRLGFEYEPADAALEELLARVADRDAAELLRGEKGDDDDAEPEGVRPTTSRLELVRDGTAAYLPCPGCGERISVSSAGLDWTIRSPRDVGERLVCQLGALAREELHVLLLNSRNRVIAQERLYQGNVSSAQVRVGELFREAVHRHLPGIILVHNHPSGDPSPSPDDLALTAEAIAAGRLLDIAVLDHIVIGGDGYISLRDRGVSFDHR